jgi:putative oxidoreductase
MMGFLFGGVDIRPKAGNVGLMLLRIYTGLSLAFAHGVGKVPPSEGFVGGVTKLGFPMPALFAWAAGSAELFGGVFLAAGFMTRPAAFFVAFTMLVAGLIQHAADPFGRKEKAFLFLFIAILYMLIGAGRYSVDGVIKRQDEMNEDSW